MGIPAERDLPFEISIALDRKCTTQEPGFVPFHHDISVRLWPVTAEIDFIVGAFGHGEPEVCLREGIY
jgi:hypothetical protein